MSIISIYYKSNSMIVASCCCIMPEAGVRGGGGGGSGGGLIWTDGRGRKLREKGPATLLSTSNILSHNTYIIIILK